MARTARLLPALALIVLSCGLAACGGGGSDDSPTDLVKQTFGGDHPIKSGKLDVRLRFDSVGLASLKGPVSLKLNGPFASVGKGQLPRFDFNLEIGTGGTNLAAGAISLGDRGYLKLAGTSYAVSDQLFKQFKDGYEKSAKDSSAKSAAPSFASLGIHPENWLKDPKKAGEEKVGGVDTIHVTAAIDIQKFLTDVSTLLGKAGSLGQGQGVPSSLTAQQRKDIAAAVKSTKLDIWTGKDDKTLRKLTLDVDIAVPADVRKRAGGLESGKLSVSLLLADLNKPQTIAAPANAKPLSDLTQALGGTSNGTGTATTPAAPAPSATTTTPATTPPAGTSQEYLDCLSKAGSDIAKVQECASLLGA
jgi:hypothetical protein